MNANIACGFVQPYIKFKVIISFFHSILGFIFDCWWNAQQPSRVIERPVLGWSFPHRTSSHRRLRDVSRRSSMSLNRQHSRIQRWRRDCITTFCQIHLSHVGIWGKYIHKMSSPAAFQFGKIKNLLRVKSINILILNIIVMHPRKELMMWLTLLMMMIVFIYSHKSQNPWGMVTWRPNQNLYL